MGFARCSPWLYSNITEIPGGIRGAHAIAVTREADRPVSLNEMPAAFRPEQTAASGALATLDSVSRQLPIVVAAVQLRLIWLAEAAAAVSPEGAEGCRITATAALNAAICIIHAALEDRGAVAE